jgi:hypothetical protein
MSGGLPPLSSSWRKGHLRLRTRFFLQLTPCVHTPYVTSSLTRGWVCLLWNTLGLDKCTYRTYSVLLKILTFALYTSPLSAQADHASRAYLML